MELMYPGLGQIRVNHAFLNDVFSTLL